MAKQKEVKEMSKKTVWILVISIVVAVALISIPIIYLSTQPETAYIYITTEGFGDKDITEERVLKVEPGDSLVDIFCTKYTDIYEDFEKPLVIRNEFVDFLGKKTTGTNDTIRVYVDGDLKQDVEQEYLYSDQRVHIVYNQN